MKFTKSEVGVVIPGATVHSFNEQTIEILKFAWRNGFEINKAELDKAEDEVRSGEISYDELESLGWALEEALEYLNENCVEDKLVFTFRDSDFVLIGVNEFE